MLVIKKVKIRFLNKWFITLMLGRIVRDVIRKFSKIEINKKNVIIIPFPFHIFRDSRILDSLNLIQARSRGWHTKILACGGGFAGSCSLYPAADQLTEDPERVCERCISVSKTIAFAVGAELQIVEMPDITESLQSKKDSNVLLKIAERQVLNGWAVDRSCLIDNFDVKVAEAVLFLKGAERGLVGELESYQRDDEVVVISNDSFYGVWRIADLLCRERGYKFLNFWPVRSCRVAISSCGSAMGIDGDSIITPQLGSFKYDTKEVETWLEGFGRGYRWENKRDLTGEEEDIFEKALQAAWRSVSILCANVSWDLMAVDKSTTAFKSQDDWISKTINWYAANPEHLLLVKAHPGEVAAGVPSTKHSMELVFSELKASAASNNIVFLGPESSYSLQQLCDLFEQPRILVWTSTVGYEFAAKGFEVVACGNLHAKKFGFLNAPSSVLQYERLLSQKCRKIDRDRQEQARAYLSWFNFCYYQLFDIWNINGRINKNIFLRELFWSERILKTFLKSCYVQDGVQ